MPQWLLMVIELVFLAGFLIGVALVYVPAAIMLGGLIGVYACERWAADETARRKAALK